MRFVTDTHCLFWYLEADPQLSAASKKLFDKQEWEHKIFIPTVVLAELLYINRKYGGPPFSKTLDALEMNKQFEVSPLSAPIIRKTIPLTHFEMHDALIVATALHLDLPLMTVDTAIIRSGLVQTLNPSI